MKLQIFHKIQNMKIQKLLQETFRLIINFNHSTWILAIKRKSQPNQVVLSNSKPDNQTFKEPLNRQGKWIKE